MENLSGIVIKGENIGEKQGYPTANLSSRCLAGKRLSKGVFVAEAELAEKKYSALVVIGVPGIKIQKKGKVEVYLLNYRGNLYKKKIKVKIFKKLRPLIIFAKKKDLLRQIKEDIKKAKKFFK